MFFLPPRFARTEFQQIRVFSSVLFAHAIVQLARNSYPAIFRIAAKSETFPPIFPFELQPLASDCYNHRTRFCRRPGRTLTVFPCLLITQRGFVSAPMHLLQSVGIICRGIKASPGHTIEPNYIVITRLLPSLPAIIISVGSPVPLSLFLSPTRGPGGGNIYYTLNQEEGGEMRCERG